MMLVGDREKLVCFPSHVYTPDCEAADLNLQDGSVIFPAQNWIEEGSDQSVRDNVAFFCVFWKSGRLGISE